MKFHEPAQKSCRHWQKAEKRRKDSGRLPAGKHRARVKLTMENDRGKQVAVVGVNNRVKSNNNFGDKNQGKYPDGK